MAGVAFSWKAPKRRRINGELEQAFVELENFEPEVHWEPQRGMLALETPEAKGFRLRDEGFQLAEAGRYAWVADKRFEISKFKFKFPRARTYEIIGLVLGCIEAKFCK